MLVPLPLQADLLFWMWKSGIPGHKWPTLPQWRLLPPHQLKHSTGQLFYLQNLHPKHPEPKCNPQPNLPATYAWVTVSPIPSHFFISVDLYAYFKVEIWLAFRQNMLAAWESKFIAPKAWFLLAILGKTIGSQNASLIWIMWCDSVLLFQCEHLKICVKVDSIKYLM